MREKILIIDHYPDSGKMMVLAMEALGHEVQLAKDGPSALKKIEKFVPDVVLCDICMPGMLGYDVCTKMKSDSRLKHTIFIAQTGIDSTIGKQRAAEAGFAYHMVKPVDINKLAELITVERGKLLETGVH